MFTSLFYIWTIYSHQILHQHACMWQTLPVCPLTAAHPATYLSATPCTLGDSSTVQVSHLLTFLHWQDGQAAKAKHITPSRRAEEKAHPSSPLSCSPSLCLSPITTQPNNSLSWSKTNVMACTFPKAFIPMPLAHASLLSCLA